MVHRGQKLARPPPSYPARFRSKKNSASILSSIQQLWLECTPAFAQRRLADRAQALSLSSLLCLGRHTVTGLLTTCGREFEDWSAPYRLFSQHRFPVADIFSVVRRAVLSELPPQAPLCVAIDDTLLRKSGTHIPGVAWRRDPLGPHFQTNFVRAQRCLQFSASIPLDDGAHRMVPISFRHAPTIPKPPSKASLEELNKYRQDTRSVRLPLLAIQQVTSLRADLDAEPDGSLRPLHLFVDNGYTNSTTLKKLPARTTLTGRVRKDAKLYFLPEAVSTPTPRGRPRRYGAIAPTPEQLRIDASVPWTPLTVCISGVPHPIRVKRLENVLWRTAGLQHTLQLVVIAPLSYRLRKGSKILYRQPAFLICTDPQLDLLPLVQGYVDRWDIEVNFREEKTLLGVGQAQVRNPESAESVPALQVASYAMLLLASLRTLRSPAKPDLLPSPKWSADRAPKRFSTQRAINQLRAEVWAHGLGLGNFSDFASRTATIVKADKFHLDLSSAVLYATN